MHARRIGHSDTPTVYWDGIERALMDRWSMEHMSSSKSSSTAYSPYMYFTETLRSIVPH